MNHWHEQLLDEDAHVDAIEIADRFKGGMHLVVELGSDVFPFDGHGSDLSFCFVVFGRRNPFAKNAPADIGAKFFARNGVTGGSSGFLDRQAVLRRERARSGEPWRHISAVAVAKEGCDGRLTAKDLCGPVQRDLLGRKGLVHAR